MAWNFVLDLLVASNMGMALQHLGPWATCSSLCFFIGALCGGDVLALRGALMLAYVFNLINGLTGVPSFPYYNVEGRLNVDMVFWAVASGFLHGCSVARMLLDELPIRFASDDDEQLARFFNRRSGMERLEARETLKRGKWIRVSAGDRIVSSVELHEQVYLLVEGKCCFNSACCFPSRFGAHHSPHHHHHHHHHHHDHNHHQQNQQQQQQQPTAATASSNTAAAAVANITHSQAPTPALPAVPPTSSPLMPSPIKTHNNPLTNHSHCSSSSNTAAANTAMHKAAADADAAAAGTAAAADASEPSGLVDPPLGSPPLLRSGHVFSLSALNVFGVYIGFDQDHGRHLEVWAESDCLLYSWPISALEECANYSPALASYWRSFILYSVASEFEHRAHHVMARCSTGEYEGPGWLSGQRSRDFTDPLRPYEQPAKPSWAGVTRWLKKAVSPFPPHGIRHTALPTTGVMARIRAMAIADARKQAEDAAHAKQAELEEIAACSICSENIGALMLTPRTAAALRHERERAWLQAWNATAAVQNTSIWLGLPQGCAPDRMGYAAAQNQQQQQQGSLPTSGSSAGGLLPAQDQATWQAYHGMPPCSAMPPEMRQQQQQQVWLQPPQLRAAASGSSTIWSGLPSVPRFDPASQQQQQQQQQHEYHWDQQQQKLQQDAAKAWFLRAHPIPIQVSSDDEGSTAGSIVTTPLLRGRR